MSGPMDDLSDGIVAHVVIDLHANKNNRGGGQAEAWGLIDDDQFILLHSDTMAAWDECGLTGEPITLTQPELASVSHADGHEPERVQVALATFRLTGKVGPK